MMRASVQWLLLGILIAVDVVLIGRRLEGESCQGCVRAPVSQLATAKSAIDKLRADCGRYPTTAEGLRALADSPPDLKEYWKGPYASGSFENDYWGHPYLYESDGPDRYTLTSLGADGKTGGEGESADLEVND